MLKLFVLVDLLQQACMLRFWKGKGTKAFSLWQRAPYEEIVHFYSSIWRAPRQWQGATEAIAFVKYQAWDWDFAGSGWLKRLDQGYNCPNSQLIFLIESPPKLGMHHVWSVGLSVGFLMAGQILCVCILPSISCTVYSYQWNNKPDHVHAFLIIDCAGLPTAQRVNRTSHTPQVNFKSHDQMKRGILSTLEKKAIS